jgi:hypothetical protein
LQKTSKQGGEMITEKEKTGKIALFIIVSILAISGWIFFILRGAACAPPQQNQTAEVEKMTDD